MTERQNRYRKSRLVPSRPFPSSNDVPVLLLNQPKVEPGSTFTFTRDPPPLMFGLCLVIRSSGSSYVSRKLSTYSSPKPTLTLTSHLGLRGPIFLPISQLKRSQYQEVLGTNCNPLQVKLKKSQRCKDDPRSRIFLVLGSSPLHVNSL